MSTSLFREKTSPATPKPMDKATVDKARTARHLLPDPGPEVVGDFIATIDKLSEYAKHKTECSYDEPSTSPCTCGLLPFLKVPEVDVVVKFNTESSPPAQADEDSVANAAILSKVKDAVRFIDVSDSGDLIESLSNVREIVGFEPLNMDDE